MHQLAETRFRPDELAKRDRDRGGATVCDSAILGRLGRKD
jgi:hypothetical protein